MKTEELKKTVERIDWDIFLKQKEWLYSQQCYLEKWYGTEASSLPEGILNLMDKIQEVWETDDQEMNANNDKIEAKDLCWYEEFWNDEDLETALENADIEVTDEHVARLKRECQQQHIFDDKSERNEMLADLARNIF